MTTPAESTLSSSSPPSSSHYQGSDFSGWNTTTDTTTRQHQPPLFTSPSSDVGSEAEYGLDPRDYYDTNDNGNDNNNKTDKSAGTKRQVGGAAVAAGIAGALLVGPVVGLVAAGGAAVVATKHHGAAGNVARASGDVVANAGERLRQLDQKHKVTHKATKGFVKGAEWVSHKLKVKNKSGNSRGGAAATNAGDNLTA